MNVQKIKQKIVVLNPVQLSKIKGGTSDTSNQSSIIEIDMDEI